MKVAILGGTGKLGLALALRLNRNGHAVVIGSRDVAKAVEAGTIEIAGCLERMTVLLLSINKANKVKETGIKITGI